MNPMEFISYKIHHSLHLEIFSALVLISFILDKEA